MRPKDPSAPSFLGTEHTIILSFSLQEKRPHPVRPDSCILWVFGPDVKGGDVSTCQVDNRPAIMMCVDWGCPQRNRWNLSSRFCDTSSIVNPWGGGVAAVQLT